MSPKKFFEISSKNKGYKTKHIELANGAIFEVLDLTKTEIGKASNILYLHINRSTKQCYVGITEQQAHKRWYSGIAYTNNRRFGSAIRKYGWEQFDSHILAFGDSREKLNNAEIDAIALAGGHGTKYTYNLSPGGDTVAENDIPIVGVNLKTGETRSFKSGSDAARTLGFKSTDMPMAVARGNRTSVGNWWFRHAVDKDKKPPEIWGDKLRISEVQKKQSKNLIAISYETKEERLFKTLEEAAKFIGVTKGHISLVALGKNQSANGWWIKYEGDKTELPSNYGSAARREKRDQKVYAVNLKTGDHKSFRNCTVADVELGIYKGAAASVASGKRSSAAGWWFSYKVGQKPPTKFKGTLVAEARSKPIVAIEISTNKEMSFKSAKEAETALGIHRSSISNILKGKRESSKGYRFRHDQ